MRFERKMCNVGRTSRKREKVVSTSADHESTRVAHKHAAEKEAPA